MIPLSLQWIIYLLIDQADYICTKSVEGHYDDDLLGPMKMSLMSECKDVMDKVCNRKADECKDEVGIVFNFFFISVFL